MIFLLSSNYYRARHSTRRLLSAYLSYWSPRFLDFSNSCPSHLASFSLALCPSVFMSLLKSTMSHSERFSSSRARNRRFRFSLSIIARSSGSPAQQQIVPSSLAKKRRDKSPCVRAASFCRPYQKKSPTPSSGGGSRTGWRSRRSVTTAGAPGGHQHHVIASAAATAQAKMQAEQGSIGELRGYHNLRSRRHTLANVR